MSWTRHEVIVVTGWNRGQVTAALSHALSHGLPCTGVIHALVNQYYTFLVGPDGSKEEWRDARECAAKRDALRSYLRKTDLLWVEMEYGEGGAPAIGSHSQEVKGEGNAV